MASQTSPINTQTPQVDEAALLAFLKTQPDIVAAYLFGSLAQGHATPQSDVDIAVLLKDASADLTLTNRRLQLMGAVERFANGEVDVVILNNASLVLQHQVLRYGRRLYESDRNARIEFQVRAGKIYADEQPMRDFFTQALFKEIQEGRFGGRRRSHSRKAQVPAKRNQLPAKRAR